MKWERVTFQESTDAVDDHGQPTKVWPDIKTVSAQFMDVGGSANTRDGQLEEITVSRFRIRYPRSGGWFPTVKMRVAFRNRTMNVKSVIDKEGRGEWLVIDCVEST